MFCVFFLKCVYSGGGENVLKFFRLIVEIRTLRVTFFFKARLALLPLPHLLGSLWHFKVYMADKKRVVVQEISYLTLALTWPWYFLGLEGVKTTSVS